MNKFNGFIRADMIAGSHKDMTIAYVFRVFTVIAQGVGVLILWALFSLGVTIRDDTRDIKREWPSMKQDISDLKLHAITKKDFDKILEAKLKEFKVNNEGRLIVAP